MKQMRSLYRVTVFVAVSLVCITGSFHAYGQEVLRGLDLSKVGFDLRAPGPFHKDLEARAMKQFNDAGLRLGEANMLPSIKLSLSPIESEHCKGFEIYQPKLELLEEVALVRSGHKRIATTWFMGQEFGHETKPHSLSDLQEEQDEMLKVFIDQYKFLNPRK
jgi:hypothetical protein